MYRFISILAIINLFVTPNVCLGIQKAEIVVVVKSESKLLLRKDGKVIKEYRVALGGNPRGHKQQEGDGRTPEGLYVLDYKNPNSEFYKSIHISYPNADDRKTARELGVSPGGAIMIHGQKNGADRLSTEIIQLFNWTDGCIAVTNSAMDEIWQAVDINTPIRIKP
ncbi:MAG: murein L,D-transpeptidase family protein [Desulfobacterales bacterium]